MNLSGNFATSRRVTVDEFSIKQAGLMLKRAPGAYQSTSMATGVPIDRLKALYPNCSRPLNLKPLARVIPAPVEPVEVLIEGDRTTVGQIIQAVSSFYSVSSTEIVGARRDKKAVRARQVAMWLSRELTKASTPEIGRRLGDRDHSTIIHGCKAIEAARAEDDKLRADLAALRSILLSDTKSLDLAIEDHLKAIRELEALKACRKAMARAA